MLPDPATGLLQTIPLVTGVFSTNVTAPVSPLNILSLLATVAILFIAWQAWVNRPRLNDVRERPRTEPADDLHPAYAGLLASGRVRDCQIEATVLEMIRRGVIALEPDHDQRDKVQIRVLDPSETSIPLEEELIGLLRDRERDGTVRYEELRRLRNHWGGLRDRLARDAADQGWLNLSFLQTRLPFVLPGLLGIGLAVTAIVVAISTGSGWPVLGGIIVGLTGTFVLSIGNIIPQTTVEGERAAIPWRGLRSGLATARENGSTDLDLDRVFPYIVSMGLAAQYDRYLRRASQSGYIPAWIGRRKWVQDWPEAWHTYWIALHTALAPTDPANTTQPTGSVWRRSLTGGRF